MAGVAGGLVATAVDGLAVSEPGGSIGGGLRDPAIIFPARGDLSRRWPPPLTPFQPWTRWSDRLAATMLMAESTIRSSRAACAPRQ
jgi:hypothetical protein